MSIIIELTEEELLSFDGNCPDSMQQKIEEIKQNRSFSDNPLIGKTITESLESGTFTYERCSTGYCPICKKTKKYAQFKSGPRKGMNNPNKPLFFRGYLLNPGFIRIQGCCDICWECEEKMNLLQTIKQIILDRDLKIELLRDEDTKYQKDKTQICCECKKTIYESEMGRLPCLMGGTYPGKCPHCGSESFMFHHNDPSPKFRMIIKERK